MECFRTVILDRCDILDVLKMIQVFIQSSWGDEIKMAHGGMTDVNEEKYHKWWNIEANELYTSVLNQEKLEPYIVGSSDLFISNLIESECIHLCHEADIHFDVEPDLANKIKNALNQLQIKLELEQ